MFDKDKGKLSKPFNPSKIQCNNCKDIIYSRYPGEWVACSCFTDSVECTGVYIDSTHEYERVGAASADSYTIIFDAGKGTSTEGAVEERGTDG